MWVTKVSMYIWFACFFIIVNLTVTFRPCPVLQTSIRTDCTLLVTCPSYTPRTTCVITRVSILSLRASLCTATTDFITDSFDTMYWTLWITCVSPITGLTAVTISIIYNTVAFFTSCRAYGITSRSPLSVYTSIGTVSWTIADIIFASCLTS